MNKCNVGGTVKGVFFFSCSPVHHGGIPERSNGADCKSVGLAFEGANPPPPTKTKQRNFRCFVTSYVCTYIRTSYPAEVAHLVERKPSKLQVAGSSPVFRSDDKQRLCSSGVEHFLGKEGVSSSILLKGSHNGTPPCVRCRDLPRYVSAKIFQYLTNQ